MGRTFDTIIIGSGVAGMAIANGLVADGKKVAIIEDDLWGGTCPNRGCDPKKTLYSIVEARDSVTQLIGKGFSHTPQVNWSELMTFKESIINPMSKASKKSLQSAGVETIIGKAKFIDEKTVQVDDETFSAETFVIATGARPSLLPIEGKDYLLTSEDFLSLPEMPKTVTFIGGGYISFELATIANAAGAKVHVIHHNDKPLKAFDSELVKKSVQQLESKGVIFHFNMNTKEIKKTNDSFLVIAENNESIQTDLIVCATGRIPNIEELDLDKAKVKYDKNGIQINDYLETSSKNIFACGDVLSKNKEKLTPVASFEGNYLVEYLTGKTTEKIVYPCIPTVVYSSPKLAQTGVSIEQAMQQEDTYEIVEIDATSWFSYSRVNEPISKIKTIKNRKTGLLVGATCLNDRADDLINFLSMIIDKKMTAEDAAKRIVAYPTIASDLSSIYI